MIKQVKIVDPKANKIVATIEQEYTAHEVLIQLEECETRKKALLKQLENIESELTALNELVNSNKELFDNITPPNIIRTGE